MLDLQCHQLSHTLTEITPKHSVRNIPEHHVYDPPNETKSFGFERVQGKGFAVHVATLV